MLKYFIYNKIDEKQLNIRTMDAIMLTLKGETERVKVDPNA